MKKSQNHVLLIVFTLFSVLNSAFIIHSPIKPTSHTTIHDLKAPPQYKAPKMSFWQSLIINKFTKKLKADPSIDLDKTAKSAKKIGSVSIPFFAVSLLLLLVGAGYYSIVALISGLIALVLTGLLGLISLYKALLVIDDPSATVAQKEMAQKGKRSGAWGLGLAAVFFILGALYLRFTFDD